MQSTTRLPQSANLLSRLFYFASTLAKSRSPQLARHMAFHQHAEHWAMIQFRDGADAFYHSKHQITCNKCRINHTAQRIWPKFNADLESGYPLIEARAKAAAYPAEHSD